MDIAIAHEQSVTLSHVACLTAPSAPPAGSDAIAPSPPKLLSHSQWNSEGTFQMKMPPSVPTEMMRFSSGEMRTCHRRKVPF